MAPGLQPPLDLFGPAHLTTLALVAAACVALPLAARRLPDPWPDRLARALAVFLIAWRALEVTVRNLVYGMPWVEQLPFHLCGLLVFVCAWMLWSGSYRVYEVTWFWAVGGTAQALLTPNLPVGFPHPGYLMFFVTHGTLVLSAFYATLVWGYRPRPVSVLKAWGWLNVYALAVTPVNLLLDTNYLYLRHKPEGVSVLDLFGPWPWYLGVLELLALGVFALCHLPFALQRSKMEI